MIQQEYSPVLNCVARNKKSYKIMLLLAILNCTVLFTTLVVLNCSSRTNLQHRESNSMSVFKNLRREFNKYGKVQPSLRHNCLYVLIYLLSFVISFVGLLSTDACG